jgi:uncharacterized tellurite resistance protein B-like protein
MKDTDRVPGLKAKAKALEDSFFAKENARLLAKLREEAAREEKRKEFRTVLNVANDQLLDALIALGVEAETLVALSLVPLVQVAWADGEIHDKERSAILRAAEERGVAPGAATHDLLESWLLTKPKAELFEVWQRYVGEIMASLDEEARGQLKAAALGRARAVAEAAGGFLGVGAISAAEKSMLEKLEWAFD